MNFPAHIADLNGKITDLLHRAVDQARRTQKLEYWVHVRDLAIMRLGASAETIFQYRNDTGAMNMRYAILLFLLDAGCPQQHLPHLMNRHRTTLISSIENAHAWKHTPAIARLRACIDIPL